MAEDSAHMEIRFLKTADTNAMEILYKDAGWWDAGFEENPESLHKIVRDSALFAGAFSGKKMIGMGRALSDLASDAYIQDIVVLTPYRGKGIGKMIIQRLISGLKQNGVDWIGLIGKPGTRKFYEDLGFRELEKHIPMKLEE